MWFSRDGDTLTVFIYTQPGAKSTEVVGIHDGALKIRLNTPPIDGRANVALKTFLAKLFQVPTRNVLLITGEKYRRKKFNILNSCVDPESLSFVSK